MSNSFYDATKRTKRLTKSVVRETETYTITNRYCNIYLLPVCMPAYLF